MIQPTGMWKKNVCGKKKQQQNKTLKDLACKINAFVFLCCGAYCCFVCDCLCTWMNCMFRYINSSVCSQLWREQVMELIKRNYLFHHSSGNVITMLCVLCSFYTYLCCLKSYSGCHDNQLVKSRSILSGKIERNI